MKRYISTVLCLALLLCSCFGKDREKIGEDTHATISQTDADHDTAETLPNDGVVTVGEDAEAQILYENDFDGGLDGPWIKYEYNDILNSNVYADGVGDCVFVRSKQGELFVMYHKHTAIGNLGESRSICIDRVYFTASDGDEADVLCIFGPTVTRQQMPQG